MIVFGSRMYGRKNIVNGWGKCEHCGDFYMPQPGIEAMHVPEINGEPDLDAIGLICTNCGGML